MKGLTLWEPWASLVALALKRVETRSWSTRYRGELLICAAKQRNRTGRQATTRDRFLFSLGARAWDDPFAAYNRLPHGHALAVVTLVDVAPISSVWRPGLTLDAGGARWELTADEVAFGDYRPGRFAWLLRDVRPLARPIPARGGQRLWTVERPLLDAVRLGVAA